MSAIDTLVKSFSSAFDSIMNTVIFYKANRVSILQAGIIAIIPQMTAFLLEYNKEFGINVKFKVENYPLLLFIFLICLFYVLLERKFRTKKSDDVFKLAFLSIHIFAFALALNLIYAMSLQIWGVTDVLNAQIANAATLLSENLRPSVFAIMYGFPFLILSVVLVFCNSYRRHPKRMQPVIRAPFFWRTFLLVFILAAYQYMAFILVKAAVS